VPVGSARIAVTYARRGCETKRAGGDRALPIATRRGHPRGPARPRRGTCLELGGRVRRLVYLLVVCAAGCEPPGYGRHHDVDAGRDASHAIDAAPDGSPATTCNHMFSLAGYASASSVWLTGNFVHWAGDPPSGAIAFTLGGDGSWTGSYDFAAGMYQYKLIINSTMWIADPSDPNTMPDGFGGTNSLYTCMP
jgi:hypothetical protein